MDLEAHVGCLPRHLCAEELNEKRVVACIVTSIELRRSPIDEQLGGLKGDMGIDKSPLDRLPLRQRLAESNSLLRIGGRELECPASRSQRPRRLLQTASRQPLLAKRKSA